MLARVSQALKACWQQPLEQLAAVSVPAVDPHDRLLRCLDLGPHAFGEFSLALVQANSLIEDYCQIETGAYGTLVGVYDGHKGPEAARYITDHLFLNIQKFLAEEGGMSVNVLRKAFLAAEEGFMEQVADAWQSKPQIAVVGSCCLVGVMWGGQLYVANLGDSRVVLASMTSVGALSTMQLSTEHNAGIEAVREELKMLHPDDPKIVISKNGVWRVKGIIQVTRSIGDAYLKKQEFNREPLLSRFRLSEPMEKPLLLAEPTIFVRTLQPEDQFLIFASDGLWEHLTNEEAVDIVQNHPRMGIARTLIKAALHEAAAKRETTYTDIKQLARGTRRHFHDDITVIVIFLDYELIKGGSKATALSIRSRTDNVEASSNILLLKGLDDNNLHILDEKSESAVQ